MRNRYTLVCILVLAALASIVTPGLAARSATVTALPPGTIQPLHVTQSVGTVACALGVTDYYYTADFLTPDNDEYYTLVDPEACGCDEDGVALTSAHVLLQFPEVPKTIPFTVAVVAADLTNPACPVPLRDQYLCPPVDYDVTVTAAGSYDIAMPLSEACCITGKAFLLIKFRTCGGYGQAPLLILSETCSACTSWNYYPGIPEITDLCVSCLIGNPTMYADGVCCSVVPALPQTWGRLKTLYR